MAIESLTAVAGLALKLAVTVSVGAVVRVSVPAASKKSVQLTGVSLSTLTVRVSGVLESAAI